MAAAICRARRNRHRMPAMRYLFEARESRPRGVVGVVVAIEPS